MLYRPYGKTGEQVSILSMGGMRYEAPTEIDRMAEIPLYLYEQGVTYFDTAPGYCQDKSEIILGTAIKEMKKRQAAGGRKFLVATKTFAATEDDVRKQLETSLERLNVDQIDFYHTWCLKSWPEWEERQKKGVVAAFRKMKEEGLVRHICVSSHLDAADTARLVGEGVYEGILLGFCAANFMYREEGIKAAHAAGLGVMVMNPLGGGVYWQAPDKFEFLKREPGDDLLRGGLRFVMSYPEVTGALVGVRNLDDARTAVEAVEGIKLYDAAGLEAAKASACEGFAQLCTGCGYCKDCPEGIPVPRLMDTFNYVTMRQEAQVWGRLKYHWGVDPVDAVIDSCIDCGQCEQECTQQLPIRERMRGLRDVWKKADDEVKARQKQKK